MSDRLRSIATVFITLLIFMGLFIWCIVKPADKLSDSERRPLASKPALSASSLYDGSFMSAFEKYTTDQFPIRDTFRSIKSFTSFNIFRNKDVNKIYFNGDGYLSKLEYPLNESSIQNAADKFMKIKEKYLSKDGIKVYISIIPDKNYFMAQECDVLMMDYSNLVSIVQQRTNGMQYIDIFDALALENYYKTDTHWRQEALKNVTKRLSSAMGFELTENYSMERLGKEFYGVYSDQSAMNISPEALYYITNEVINSFKVFDYETSREIPVYDMEKANGKDGYEIFLSGSKSLLKITNSKSDNDKTLIVFRDSFGSSLAPLLAEGYRETYVIDIRYISSEILDKFVDFEDCDVLFIYSALILNNSVTLK